MKKALPIIVATIAVLTVTVLCVVLFVGGGVQQSQKETASNTPESNLVGEWKNVGGGSITFNEDGTGIAPAGDSFDWRYDQESTWYYVSYQGVSFSFTIKEKNNARLITLEGTAFYHADDFGEIYTAYVEEKFKNLTNGRTELLAGNTYTTDDGIEFVFEKAELREEKSPWGDKVLGSFTLYITCESELSISDEKYTTPGRYSSFGLGNQPQWKEGNTYCFSGGFEELADLEADKYGDFGILSFTINGTAYYIRIETFFE